MTVGAHQHSMKIPHNLLKSEIEKIIPGVEDNQENVDVVSAENLPINR